MRWLLVLVLVLLAAGAWALRSSDVSPPPRTDDVAIVATDTDAAPPAVGSTPAGGDSHVAATPTAGAAVDMPANEADEPVPAEQPSTEQPPQVTSLSFLVVDEVKRAIEGASVVVFAGERDLAMTRTDGKGRASLRAVPVDSRYRVVARGYLPHVGQMIVDREVQRVTMRSAPMLRGRVFSPGGQLVADALAVLLPPVKGRPAAPPVLPPDCHTCKSNERGEFAMPWPDYELHDLVVTRQGFAPKVVPRIDAHGQGLGVMIVSLQPGARIEGQAQRDAGTPLPSVLVHVWSVAGSGWRRERMLGTPQPWLGGHALGTVTTDHEGRFVCEDLPAGPAWVTFAGHVSGGAQLVVLEPGGVRTLTLQAPKMATVLGRAAAGIGGEAFLRGDSVRLAPVDGYGNFRFEQVPPGLYLVGLRREPFAQHLHAVVQQFLTEGESPHCLTIDLAPGESREVVLGRSSASLGSVVGQAFFDGGVPAKGCRVVAESVLAIGASRRRSRVRADGSFRINYMRPGDYVVRLMMSVDDTVLAEQPCRVSAGNSSVVTLVLR